MAKIVIAGGEFPGSIETTDFCSIAHSTIKTTYPDDYIVTYPLASGGKGTIAAFNHYIEGSIINIPFNNRFESYFLSNQIAVIEGYLEDELERLDFLIKDADAKGATTIYLGLKETILNGPDSTLLSTLKARLDSNHESNILKDLTIIGLVAARFEEKTISFLDLNIKLTSGAKMIYQLSKIDEAIKDADLVITGTGLFDDHTVNDEITGCLINSCQHYNVPLVILSGQSPNYQFKIPLVDIYALSPANMPADIALKEMANNLRYTLIDLVKQDII